MPSMGISNIEAAVGGAAAYDIQPPAGQAWLIKELGSDAVFVTNQPDLAYGIADGVLTLANIVIDPTTDPQKGDREKEIYITNANYLTVTNTAVGAANVGWTGERVDPNVVITDMVTCPTGGAGLVDIQPPVGQTWRITEIGAELYNGGQSHPEVIIGITDGALVASVILTEAEDRAQYKALDWIIDNTIYLRVTNNGAADVDFAYSGVLTEKTSIGSVQDVVGSATLDIQPPLGQEWVITEIAAETWTAAAPNSVPNILVSLYDGAVLSDVLESVAPSLAWNRKFHLHIDNATYLRITEISTANNEVGILGYLKRSYS